MRPTIFLRGTAAWLALVPGFLACGASKSDFINDDPEITSGSAGGSAAQGPASSGSGGSGGTAAGGSTSGTESGATRTTSGAGGTGGPTTTGGTNGTNTTGSSGGSSSSNTSASTTTGGGDGGVGGAPQIECREDGDCGLAKDISACCAGCTTAFPADAIAADPCLLGTSEEDAEKCDRPVCTDVLCPTIACEEPAYAACEAGQCVAKHECPKGTVLDRGSCVPPCTKNDDCVVATRAGECCESCPAAYHRQVVDADPCLLPPGKPAPKACQPNPDECALVLCPAVLCVEPGSAVCAEDGSCVMSSELAE